MLNKLLKYDLKSIFKLWWIFALTSVGAAIIGTLSLFGINTFSASENESALFVILTVICVAGFFISMLLTAGFFIGSEILIYVRFYKNFFSDEGYLTFTLPVKRHQLLTSKLIMAVITEICTLTLYFTELFLIFFIGLMPSLPPSLYTAFFESIWIWILDAGIFSVIYLLEALIIILLSSVCSVLLVFTCISFGAMIAKKHKILASVGIYYLATSIVSSADSTAMVWGSILTLSFAYTILPSLSFVFIALALLLVIAICISTAILLYALVHYTLDKKLNLA